MHKTRYTILVYYLFWSMLYFCHSTIVSSVYSKDHDGCVYLMQAGCTALNIASKAGHIDAVIMLLENGADLNIQDYVS